MEKKENTYMVMPKQATDNKHTQICLNCTVSELNIDGVSTYFRSWYLINIILLNQKWSYNIKHIYIEIINWPIQHADKHTLRVQVLWSLAYSYKSMHTRPHTNPNNQMHERGAELLDQSLNKLKVSTDLRVSRQFVPQNGTIVSKCTLTSLNIWCP